MSALDRPVVVRLEPLADAHVSASIDGRPELRAVGASVGRALEQLARRVGYGPITAPAGSEVAHPVDFPLTRPDPAGAFRCPTYLVVVSVGSCVERFSIVNAPAPSAEQCGPWARARAESPRCVGCPIGSANVAASGGHR